METKLRQCVKMCNGLLLKIRKSDIYKKQQFSKIVTTFENLPLPFTASMLYPGIVLLYWTCTCTYTVCVNTYGYMCVRYISMYVYM